MAHGALDTLRVLDLSRILAGPYCTQLLGDYGATIVKVEEPGAGDGSRAWGPPWAGDQSAYFLAANRNKQSIGVDLNHQAGRALVAQLARVADVVIENFKPGVVDRFGLDYTTLSAASPRLVYCSITGYGQDGPYRNRPGYDFVIQAQGGLMSITGPEEGPPSKVGVAIVDISAGLFAATAILAALLERERSGRGQHIDVALFDAQIAWLANVAQNCLVTGAPARRHGNAHPSIVPYQAFATADGEIAVAVGSDEQYRRMCHAVSRPDLLEEGYLTNAGRVTHRERLIPRLEALFRSRTTEEWMALLMQIGVPVGPINDVAAALSDPQARFRGMVQSIAHPSAGDIQLLGPVAHFSRTPAEVSSPPPVLGQHTDRILQEWLHMTHDEIAELRRQGAIT